MAEKRPVLKCFIATAIGRSDIDAMFDNGLKVVLREKGVRPQRVDRIDHNEDIDDKIIQLIDECDFCIADLTYARPSVYYEAGRVHGLGKPVIFTARKDHFDPKSDDDFGNFRIHFDLQMKNIIDWTLPNNTFRRRLASRINTVLRPIIRQKLADSERREEEREFQRKPQNEKFKYFLEAITRALLRKKYQITKKYRREYVPFLNVLSFREKREGLFIVTAFVAPSFTKRDLDLYKWKPGLGGIRYWLSDEKLDQARALAIDMFFCSLRSVPPSRVSEALPSFSPDAEQGTFRGEVINWSFRSDYIPMRLHFIAPRSFTDFNKKLQLHLRLVQGSKRKVVQTKQSDAR